MSEDRRTEIDLAFEHARRQSSVAITGLDVVKMRYHQAALADVAQTYLNARYTTAHLDFTLRTESNPLETYLHTLARRHR